MEEIQKISSKLGRFHHLLPYEAYDFDTGLYINQKSVGFVLISDPMVGASFDDQGQIAHFFKDERNFPEGASLQFLLFASPSVNQGLENWAKYRTLTPYKNLAQTRIQYLKEASNIRDFKLIISYTTPKTLGVHQKEIVLPQIKNSLSSTLFEIGIQATSVQPDTLIKVMRSYMTVSEEEAISYNDKDTISKQVVPDNLDLEVSSTGLILDGTTKIQSFVPSTYPSEWALPLMDSFLGNILDKNSTIPCPFSIHYGFWALPNQSHEKAKVFSKREAHGKSLQNNLLKWLPKLQEEHEEFSQACAEIQSGERLINSLMSITLMDDAKTIDESAHRLKSIGTRLGFQFVPATHDHLPMFLSTFPMNLVEEGDKSAGFIKRLIPGNNSSKSLGGLGESLSKFGRTRKTLTREAQNMLPILGEWKGDKKSPGLLLVGRRGQIFTWSPFGPVLIQNKSKEPSSNENFNLCIAGVPGSGKSVFMQELMLSTLGVGGKVFVLDYGRSFKRTCELLKGNYIEFEVKNPISINPFSAIPECDDKFDVREDALANIYPILQTMAAPKDGTNDLQNAVLLKSMRRVWDQKKSKTEITDIAHDLLSQPEAYAKELGDMLFPFTKKGLYGSFFTGPAQVSMDSDIVVIETDHLRNQPSLLTVVVQMVIVHINQTMVNGDRRRPFLIMIDEAWKMLQGKSSGAFIEEAGRIARKYKGSIVLATQQITDYFKPESPASQKAFENASHKAILKQNPDTLSSLSEHPHLKEFVKSDYRMALLKSIHTSPPNYSEVAIFSSGVHGVVGRLMLDPFTRLLYSTNAEDYQDLQEMIDSGVCVVDAINQLLQNRGQA